MVRLNEGFKFLRQHMRIKTMFYDFIKISKL